MKTKLFYFTVMATLSGFVDISPVQAQNYDESLLKQFILPDITRKTLELELYGSGSYSNQKIEDQEREKNTSFGGNMNTTFTYYKNTRKYIGETTANVYFNMDYSKRDAEKTKYFVPKISYDTKNRFYKNNIFFELDGVASLNYERNLSDENTYYNTSFKLEVPVGVGIGRIEDITEMRQAIYVAQNLQKKGVLVEDISNPKMLELAQLMAKVKNKRFLDSRKHLEYEISQIDSFFISNNYITSSNAKYFTTLYDYWLYGDVFKRYNGMDFKGLLAPGFINERSKSSSKTKSESYNLNATFSFNYEKPLSLYWQQSVYADIKGGYTTTDGTYTPEDYDKYNTDIESFEASASAQYIIGYYPNSRTSLNLGLSENFLWNKTKWDDHDDRYSRYWITHLRFTTYYYFSPQVRLSARANLSYWYDTNSATSYPYKTRSFNTGYTLSLTYFIF
ncbi:MAG: hypothetical protein LUH22_18230 [Bacteroides sp.]|nr:hypothetical protein [Bacteroides sp.]